MRQVKGWDRVAILLWVAIGVICLVVGRIFIAQGYFVGAAMMMLIGKTQYRRGWDAGVLYATDQLIASEGVERERD